MNADELAAALVAAGYRAEPLHIPAEPERVNIWKPGSPVLDVLTVYGPWGTQAAVDAVWLMTENQFG